LPSLAEVLARVDPTHKLYGGAAKLSELAAAAEADFADDGVRGDVAVTGGALDAIERALQTELRVGDRVIVEDPSWPRIADLVHALGLAVEPVAVDERGLDAERLEEALRHGARALIATPRGQNPTGAAVDAARGRALRVLLANYPDVLVIEGDYVARVAGAPYVPLHENGGRWVVVRSLSKVLGPDLRVAVTAGDPLTISRIEGRQRLGPGWVSHILQQIAALLLRDQATARLLARAERTYAQRRAALVSALETRGIEAAGESGLGVWVPLADEAAVVRELLVQGWAVSPGERYRFHSAPGIRSRRQTSTLTRPSSWLRRSPASRARRRARTPVRGERRPRSVRSLHPRNRRAFMTPVWFRWWDASRWRTRSCVDSDPYALVGLALRLRLHDAHQADFAGSGDVRAAVGLAIEADDVDDSERVDRARDEVGFEANERRVAVGLDAG
jgi:DNA-binding transcriptional MocR family regulator